MENEVRDIWKMGVILTITASLFVIVMTFSIYARNISYSKADFDARMNRINEQSSLFKFTNDSYTMSGSDIVSFITHNTKSYNYLIAFKTGSKGTADAYGYISANCYLNSANMLIKPSSDINNSITMAYLSDMGYSSISEAPNDKLFAADNALWTQTCLMDKVFGDKINKNYTPIAYYVDDLPYDYKIADLGKLKKITDLDIMVDNMSNIVFVFEVID